MTRGRIIGALLILAVLVLAVVGVLTSDGRKEPLDPTSAAPNGSKAVAQVLRGQGVSVDVTHAAAGLGATTVGADSTVLLTRPSLLNTASLQRVARTSAGAGTLVLLAPSTAVLTALGLPIRVAPEPPAGSGVGDDCTIAPFRGLSLSDGPQSRAYSSGSGAGCAPSIEGGDVIRTLPAIVGVRPAVLVIGTEDVLRNDEITSADNAAFALRALGSTPRLTWLAADAAHADGDAVGTGNKGPWPAWTWPAIALIAVSVLLLMLWRGRRLGALVTEPLPVVVPATETTRSRGQLYRRARDTERTAAILRIASRHRLARYLGLSPGTAPPDLVRETARAAGRDPRAVDAVLVGGPVDDEAQLIRIAQELQTLERQVRR